jgi:sporulation protein YlmC with PRC-barrel domain
MAFVKTSKLEIKRTNMKSLNKLTTAATIAAISFSLSVWGNDRSSSSSSSNKGTSSDTSMTSSSSTSSSSMKSDRDTNSNSKFQSTKACKASELIGMQVKNAQDENLGSIKDLIVDFHSGKVNYAILSEGGVLGMGSKLVAIPPNQFSLNRPDNKLVLNLDKDRLNNAPQFDENAFASNPDWDRDLQKFYNTRSSSSSSKTFGSRESSKDKSLQPTGRESTDRSHDFSEYGTKGAEANEGISSPSASSSSSGSHTHSSSSSSNKSDSGLSQDIKQKLSEDSSISSANNVSVDVNNGIVTLRGTVASEREKSEVASKAEQCAGSHKVINELEVR